MARGKTEQERQEQLRRFQEAARALGCDEDEAAFDEKLKVVARQKPKAEANEAGGKEAATPKRARRSRT